MDKNKSKHLVGAHVSSSGGVFNAVKNAHDIGARAFALFLKNQRQWVANQYTEEVINKFHENMKKYNFKTEQVLAHGGYLINLGNANSEKREKSLVSFIDELKRAKALGLTKLNIHPGSHLKEITEDQCIKYIVECIDTAMSEVSDIKIVLENTAGQGSNMGYKFEHLRDIINGVKDRSRMGVCLDTCHMFAAGYDISTEDGYLKSFTQFQNIVGFNYLDGIHLNDAKINLGSKKDRHESIGKGTIGMEFFKRLMNDERFSNIPIVLETIDSSIWKDEIELLYSLEN